MALLTGLSPTRVPRGLSWSLWVEPQPGWRRLVVPRPLPVCLLELLGGWSPPILAWARRGWWSRGWGEGLPFQQGTCGPGG